MWPKERTVQCQMEVLWANGVPCEFIKNTGSFNDLFHTYFALVVPLFAKFDLSSVFAE